MLMKDQRIENHELVVPLTIQLQEIFHFFDFVVSHQMDRRVKLYHFCTLQYLKLNHQ